MVYYMLRSRWFTDKGTCYYPMNSFFPYMRIPVLAIVLPKSPDIVISPLSCSVFRMTKNSSVVTDGIELTFVGALSFFLEVIDS